MQLNNDCWGQILSFLQPREALLVYNRVNRKLRDAVTFNGTHYAAWNAQMGADEYVASLPADFPTATFDRFRATARDTFYFFAKHEQMFAAGSAYHDMSRSFKRFKQVVAVRHPELSSALQPGFASYAEFVAACADVINPAIVPIAVRILYSLLGTQGDHPTMDLWARMFGSAIVYNTVATITLAPWEWTARRAASARAMNGCFMACLVNWQGGGYDSLSPHSEIGVATSLAPALRDFDAPEVAVDSNALLSVTAQWERELHGIVIASSLVDWFVDWCDGVADGKYSFFSDEFGTHISSFAEYGPHVSSVTTAGVTVRMSPLVQPYFSPTPRKPTGRRGTVIAYRLSIGICEPRGLQQRTRRAQLATREWRCVDGEEEQPPIQGPGVIGMYPVVGPFDPAAAPAPCRFHYEWTHEDDADESATNGWFQYCSRTVLRSTCGSMEGTLRFTDLATEEAFDVAVGRCDFRVQVAVLSLARQAETRRRDRRGPPN